MLAEVEQAWAAGLFEGEGSFSTMNPNRGPRYYLRACLQTSDLDVLERFQRIVGVGRIYDVPPNARQPTGKRMYQWQASGEDAFRHVWRLLGPHLGLRRSARAAELLQQYGRIAEG